MSRLQKYLIWFLASIFYAYQNILRLLPVAAAEDLINIFSLTETTFGQVRGLYYVGYCVVHLPVAYLIDKFSLKRVLSFCIILTLIGNLPLLFASHWISLTIGRIFVGIGSSAAILGVFKAIRLFFPDDHFSRMLGGTAFIGLLGSMLGLGPLNQFISFYGYQNAISILTVIGFVLAVMLYILIPYRKEKVTESFFHEVLELLSSKKFLLVTLVGGLLIGPLEGFADGWSVPYLTSLFNISSKHANDITSVIFLGFALGAPVLSYIADVTGAHRRVMGLSGLAMGGLFLLLIALKLSLMSVIAIYFLIGVFCAYQVMVIYLAGNAVPKHLVNISGAGSNMLMMSFGWIFHSIVGFLMEGRGVKSSEGAFVTYSQEAFFQGLFIIVLTCLLGWLIFNWTKISIVYSKK